MQLLSMDQLSSMLKYICGRMKVTQGVIMGKPICFDLSVIE